MDKSCGGRRTSTWYHRRRRRRLPSQSDKEAAVIAQLESELRPVVQSVCLRKSDGRHRRRLLEDSLSAIRNNFPYKNPRFFRERFVLFTCRELVECDVRGWWVIPVRLKRGDQLCRRKTFLGVAFGGVCLFCVSWVHGRDMHPWLSVILTSAFDF